MDKIIPNFVIEYKKSLTASGVGDVISFNDREIRLSLIEGGRVCVTGEGLKIIGFEKRTGEFKMVGAVVGVKFLSGGQTTLKRFFK